MVTSGLLLAVLNLLPVWHGDAGDPIELRAARAAPVVSAVLEATDSPSERSDLLVIAYAESRLASYVLEGRCHEGPVGQRCDGGRAWGPWQVHRWCKSWGYDTPEGLVGQARCALSRLRMARAICRSRAGGLAGYRGGAPDCDPARGARLLALSQRIEGMAVE